MRRYLMMLVAAVIVVISAPQRGLTQEVTDYLILEDIGAYKLHRQSRAFPDRKLRDITPYKIFNGSSGILGGTGHCMGDHEDITYEVGYESIELDLGVIVLITHHCPPPCRIPTSQPNGLTWLLHEVEDGYRDSDVLEANWTQGARLRDIDGNLIFGVRGSGYNWLSGNIVVDIEYTDLTGTKPEPLEIVRRCTKVS